MGGFLAFILVLILIAMYFLPLFIAIRRGSQVGPVAVINFFFGWSVVGWIIALSMALSDKSGGGSAVVHNTIVMQQGPAAQASTNTDGSTNL